MSLKNIVMAGLVLVFGVLFTGCGTTQACLINYSYHMKNGEHPVMFVSGKEAWRSPSAGYNIGTRNTHILQNAAQLTLNKGYKYFAFHKPNEISNTNGGIINTAEEFMKTCVPSSANPFEIGQGRCGWFGKGAVEEALIVLFKEKPYTMLVYDASETVKYLKANNLLRDDGIDTMRTGLCKVTRKSFL